MIPVFKLTQFALSLLACNVTEVDALKWLLALTKRKLILVNSRGTGNSNLYTSLFTIELPFTNCTAYCPVVSSPSTNLDGTLLVEFIGISVVITIPVDVRTPFVISEEWKKQLGDSTASNTPSLSSSRSLKSLTPSLSKSEHKSIFLLSA